MRDPTQPKIVLRFDALAVTLIALALYRELGLSWGQFVLLFLLPDLSILGYTVNRRVGAAAYNAVHTYLWPAGLFLFGFLAARGPVMGVALIWLAHVGVDRVLGLGLKYADRPFRDTHLQRI